MYVMQSKVFLLIVILYIDDLIILINTLKKMDWLKAKLRKEFEISDLEELHYCLRMEFVRDQAKKIIILSQKKYIKEVLKRFNKEEYKPI